MKEFRTWMTNDNRFVFATEKDCDLYDHAFQKLDEMEDMGQLLTVMTPKATYYIDEIYMARSEHVTELYLISTMEIIIQTGDTINGSRVYTDYIWRLTFDQKSNTAQMEYKKAVFSLVFAEADFTLPQRDGFYPFWQSESLESVDPSVNIRDEHELLAYAKKLMEGIYLGNPE